MESISKKAGTVFLIVILALMMFVLYSILTHRSETPEDRIYRFDFEEPLSEADKEFWMISAWGDCIPDSARVEVRDGSMHLTGDAPMPYMLSAPLDITPGSVITVERRVRLTRGHDTFAAGLALYQTGDMDFVPARADGEWSRRLGDGIVLVEYSYDLLYASDRPGRDVFRFLASDWQYNRNFELVKPIYDEWFVEKLAFDMRTNQIIYKINDHVYRLNSYALDKPAVRVLMHSFGTGGGSRVEIDYVEIRIEDKSFRR